MRHFRDDDFSPRPDPQTETGQMETSVIVGVFRILPLRPLAVLLASEFDQIIRQRFQILDRLPKLVLMLVREETLVRQKLVRALRCIDDVLRIEGLVAREHLFKMLEVLPDCIQADAQELLAGKHPDQRVSCSQINTAPIPIIVIIGMIIMGCTAVAVV